MSLLIKIVILILGLTILLISFINEVKGYEQQRSISVNEETDPREEVLAKFFTSYKSPWQGKEKDFITVADTYKIDWRLLPIVGCIESSCGKFFNRNAFGWNSGRTECGDDLEDAACVAKGITTSRYYRRYRETSKLSDFAKSYNKKYWENYLGRLYYFYDKLGGENYGNN